MSSSACLIDTAAIDAVYLGPQGLLAGDAKGKLFIEMSTVTPEAQIALAEKVRAKGARLCRMPGRADRSFRRGPASCSG